VTESSDDESGASSGTTGALSKSLNGGGWVWGTFTAANVQTALDLMLESGHSKLLSDPNLTTESNKPAEIEVSTTIPIQTLNRFTEGAVVQDIVSFQELDVGIKLKVLARVTDSIFISMEVNPIIEEITGFTGPSDNLRPITSNREVKTTVRVRDGETLVIGGLLKDSEFKIIRKVPLLGHIPLLGVLFQHQTKQVERTDLTVFITPTILPSQ
jgi:general secretion pathway protein D